MPIRIEIEIVGAYLVVRLVRDDDQGSVAISESRVPTRDIVFN